MFEKNRVPNSNNGFLTFDKHDLQEGEILC